MSDDKIDDLLDALNADEIPSENRTHTSDSAIPLESSTATVDPDRPTGTNEEMNDDEVENANDVLDEDADDEGDDDDDAASEPSRKNGDAHSSDAPGLTSDPTQPEPSLKSGARSFFPIPASRVKAIMKLDPEVTLASQEAVLLVAKATEMFVASLARDAAGVTTANKKKTIQRRDLDAAIDADPTFAFLEGAIDF